MKGLKKLVGLTALNIKLQYRQGFLAAWAVITFFYLMGLSFLPDQWVKLILPLVLFTEPSTFAMIFTGAIFLLERDEGLLENLFISPLTIKSYMFSKALALSLPATASGLILALFLAPVSWAMVLILPGVILTTLFFSLLTFIPASSSRDLMGLLGRIAIYGSPFLLSILNYFGFWPGYHQFLLPSKGTLVLMETAVGKVPVNGVNLCLSLVSLIWGIIIIASPAEKSFRLHVIEKRGHR